MIPKTKKERGWEDFASIVLSFEAVVHIYSVDYNSYISSVVFRQLSAVEALQMFR